MELNIDTCGFDSCGLVKHIELYNDDIDAKNNKEEEKVFPVERKISDTSPVILKKHSWNMLVYKY